MNGSLRGVPGFPLRVSGALSMMTSRLTSSGDCSASATATPPPSEWPTTSASLHAEAPEAPARRGRPGWGSSSRRWAFPSRRGRAGRPRSRGGSVEQRDQPVPPVDRAGEAVDEDDRRARRGGRCPRTWRSPPGEAERSAPPGSVTSADFVSAVGDHRVDADAGPRARPRPRSGSSSLCPCRSVP